jgi:hypothetical protein
MLDTKLILVEGLPGAGKTTSTGYLKDLLQQRGFNCRQYLEEDDPHPIACLDFTIQGLPEKVLPLWEKFAAEEKDGRRITVMESRLWQNTALFMYMSAWDVEAIRKFSRQVHRALVPLAPVLVYLDQEDVESALRRLYTLRGEAWMEREMESTSQYPWFQSRRLDGFPGWVQFFEEWRGVAGRLFDDWMGHKIRILNPHDDWAKAYCRLETFLKIDKK